MRAEGSCLCYPAMLLDTRAGVGHHSGYKIDPHLERIVSCVVMVDNCRFFPRCNTGVFWPEVWIDAKAWKDIGTY